MPRVWDDVAFGPRNLRWPEDRVAGAVAQALRALAIEDLAGRVPSKLSYGQTKRVALAGVLARDPEILLLDEPTSWLDHPARSDLLARLASTDRTILLTTHDLADVAGFVDRVVLLRNRTIAEGEPREIPSSPDPLTAAGLDVPRAVRVAQALRLAGHGEGPLPLSMAEALRELERALALRSPIAADLSVSRRGGGA